MEQEVFKILKDELEKSLGSFSRDVAKVRAGRASVNILDGIRVDYYGTLTPLNQVATLGVPEPRLLTIQPWDPQMISVIEKTILKSDLGLTPRNDGRIIRIQIPPLTEERRKELVKLVEKTAEKFKVSCRQARKDANEKIKKLESEKSISKDSLHKS